MIQFACPHCRANLKCAEGKAGATLPCPGCRQVVQVPGAARRQPTPHLPVAQPLGAAYPAAAAPGLIQRVCRHCGAAVQVDARLLNQPMACPGCQQTFDLPAAAPPPQVVFNVINAATAGSAVVPSPPEPTPPATAWGPPSYRKRKKPHLLAPWLVVVTVGVALFACAGGLVVVRKLGADNDHAAPASPTAKAPSDAEAREQLTRALAAWAARLSKADLAAKHPKLDFVEPDCTDGFFLYRYDVADVTWEPLLHRWTAHASLVFRLVRDDRAVRYQREYSIAPPDERDVWRITVQLAGVPQDLR